MKTMFSIMTVFYFFVAPDFVFSQNLTIKKVDIFFLSDALSRVLTNDYILKNQDKVKVELLRKTHEWDSISLNKNCVLIEKSDTIFLIFNSERENGIDVIELHILYSDSLDKKQTSTFYLIKDLYLINQIEYSPDDVQVLVRYWYFDQSYQEKYFLKAEGFLEKVFSDNSSK